MLLSCHPEDRGNILLLYVTLKIEAICYFHATLKIEATCFTATLVYTYQIISHRIQGDYNFCFSGVFNFISKDLVNANNSNLTNMSGLTTKIFTQLYKY
jgi:hypothetical protein